MFLAGSQQSLKIVIEGKIYYVHVRVTLLNLKIVICLCGSVTDFCNFKKGSLKDSTVL
jgi:hypothetical protein